MAIEIVQPIGRVFSGSTYTPTALGNTIVGFDGTNIGTTPNETLTGTTGETYTLFGPIELTDFDSFYGLNATVVSLDATTVTSLGGSNLYFLEISGGTSDPLTIDSVFGPDTALTVTGPSAHLKAGEMLLAILTNDNVFLGNNPAGTATLVDNVIGAAMAYFIADTEQDYQMVFTVPQADAAYIVQQYIVRVDGATPPPGRTLVFGFDAADPTQLEMLLTNYQTGD